VIKDAKGRKWAMRFKQYQQGWQWDARLGSRDGNTGTSSARENFFETKAAAEDDARRYFETHDVVALTKEFFTRLAKRGTVCRLTAADQKAIGRAGRP
jgi:hypothetical protein